MLQTTAAYILILNPGRKQSGRVHRPPGRMLPHLESSTPGFESLFGSKTLKAETILKPTIMQEAKTRSPTTPHRAQRNPRKNLATKNTGPKAYDPDNPKPKTLNPKPKTLNPEPRAEAYTTEPQHPKLYEALDFGPQGSPGFHC